MQLAAITVDRYTPVAIVLHWLMALLVIGLWIVGSLMSDLTPPFKYTVYDLHKATGILILVLTFFRLGWRFTHPVPALPSSIPRWKGQLARIAHWALYALLILMPLSGWAMSSSAGYPVSIYGLFDMPALLDKDVALAGFFKETHELLANGLLLLVAAHTAAGLLHHYYYKDTVLRRMLPGRKGL